MSQSSLSTQNASFPRYARYKDSGVEWLGEIPEHWGCCRNLGVFDERNERGRPNDELLSVIIQRGVIRQTEITTKKDASNEDKSKYKVLKEGDLAYNKMQAWQGALGIKTSAKRTNISLVTYSGPLNTNWRHKGLSRPSIYSTSNPLPDLLYPHKIALNSTSKLSAFYFGDFNLTKTRIQPIIDHFSSQRWKRIRIVQIAHHGAKASWHKSAASHFQHADSVFSYGLHNTYKHPGKVVVEDFRHHNPVLVNERQGASSLGLLATPRST